MNKIETAVLDAISNNVETQSDSDIGFIKFEETNAYKLFQKTAA
jgi:hypothetical protein